MPVLSEFAKAFVGALVRWLCSVVFGWLVLNNVITPEEAKEWTGMLVFALPGLLLMLAWSLWNKYRLNNKIETALDLPRGTPREELERKTSVLK